MAADEFTDFDLPPHEEIHDDDPRAEQARKPNGNGGVGEAFVPPVLRAYTPRPFEQIPRRQWLHAKHYIRKHVVMTVAPGGYGKTTLLLINAIEMALKIGLLGPPPPEQLRILYWNGEDPDEEIERRIAAICIRYDINPALLEGWLFLGSKITGAQRLAWINAKQQLEINKPMLSSIASFIQANKIDGGIFDPLLPFHRVTERLNEQMEEMVTSTFGHLAERYDCCIELSHHTRKTQGGTGSEITSDDSRGGGSVTNAARSVRVMNRMTKAEAELPNIQADDRRYYLRVNRDKQNMAPAGAATWVHLASIDLPNATNGRPGDSVQVCEPWKYPLPFDNVSSADMQWVRLHVGMTDWRTDPRAKDNWVGVLVARRLSLDSENKGDRKKINEILKRWYDSGVLAKVERYDETQRKTKEYAIAGLWSDPDVAPVDDEPLAH